jgi:prevent-host-death family protein
MKTYTYTEARQKLAALLDQARREGRVQIRRRDGQLFVLQPVKAEGPLSTFPASAGACAEGSRGSG